jgi:hypothetical protein|tara:strand:- start:415 stop:744 length:330 start_codon:yes stop_codon:yes gene_type:complete
MTPKIQGIDEILPSESMEESEGAIQDLFLDHEIRVIDAAVGQGKHGKYVLITLIDSDQKQRICHSSSGVVIDNIESMKMAGLGKDLNIVCKCVKVKSLNDREYFKLVKV